MSPAAAAALRALRLLAGLPTGTGEGDGGSSPSRYVALALLALCALLLLPVLLLGLLLALLLQVPAVTPSQVQLYQEAVQRVAEETGVSVDWREALALDAVLREQDFSGLDASGAEAAVRRFVGREEATECEVTEAGTVCRTVVTYRLLSLEETMDALDLTEDQREWVRALLENAEAFAGLFSDVGASCAPEGWSPSELTWSWPVPSSHTITSCFGPRVNPVEGTDGFHYGVDVGAPSGALVVAPGDGLVTEAGPAGACGLSVRVAHRGGVATRYCHLSAVLVRRGQEVARGEAIGRVGSTGRSTGPHLHFEVHRQGRPVDPLSLF